MAARSNQRVNPQGEARNEETEGSIGTLNDTLKPAILEDEAPLPEVEVDALTETTNPAASMGVPMVEIRVNQDVEEMSFVAAGRRERYTFEQGHRYRVPIYIAQELEATGRIWH